MDVAEIRWEDLEKVVSDRDKWSARDRALKNTTRATIKERKRQTTVTITHRLHKQRFTFFTRTCKTSEQQIKKKQKKKKQNKMINEATRETRYERINAPAITHEKKTNSFLNNHHQHQRLSPTSKTVLSTWETTVVAVFSDNSNSSVFDMNDYNNNSNTDFIPKCKPFHPM